MTTNIDRINSVKLNGMHQMHPDYVFNIKSLELISDNMQTDVTYVVGRFAMSRTIWGCTFVISRLITGSLICIATTNRPATFDLKY